MRQALWLAGMLTGAYTLEIVHKFDPQRDYSGCWKPCAGTSKNSVPVQMVVSTLFGHM